jgi:hypothetical protein
MCRSYGRRKNVEGRISYFNEIDRKWGNGRHCRGYFSFFERWRRRGKGMRAREREVNEKRRGRRKV